MKLQNKRINFINQELKPKILFLNLDSLFFGNMKKLIKYIFVLLIIAVGSNTVFSFEQKIPTIKELKQRVENINKEKKQTEQKLQTLKHSLIKQNFFKTDLLKEEQEKLDILVQKYKENEQKLKNELENNLKKGGTKTKEIIKKLLLNEKEIYKQLIPFIKKEKYKQYKEFIKQDLNYINKKINLETKEKIENNKLKQKITIIKNEIQKNNSILSQKLTQIINNKIDNKLLELSQKEKFKKLSLENKINLFKKLIQKIEKKLNKIKTRENKTLLLRKKIKIYEIIIERINIFMKNNFIQE